VPKRKEETPSKEDLPMLLYNRREGGGKREKGDERLMLLKKDVSTEGKREGRHDPPFVWEIQLRNNLRREGRGGKGTGKVLHRPRPFLSGGISLD